MKTLIDHLRTVGIAEGISFLLLLGVAMPLKYLAGIPLAVKIAGWIHGLLFIIFIVVLMRVRQEHAWPAKKVAGAMLAALLPFGTFVLDAKLRKEPPAAQQ
jgi:integral membrane protein